MSFFRSVKSTRWSYAPKWRKFSTHLIHASVQNCAKVRKSCLCLCTKLLLQVCCELFWDAIARVARLFRSQECVCVCWQRIKYKNNIVILAEHASWSGQRAQSWTRRDPGNCGLRENFIHQSVFHILGPP